MSYITAVKMQDCRHLWIVDQQKTIQAIYMEQQPSQKRAKPKSQMSRNKKKIMSTNNVSLHRVIKASPEKVYRAFTEASAIASWLPPYGFLCTVHELNVKAGGTHKMSFQNFST